MPSTLPDRTGATPSRIVIGIPVVNIFSAGRDRAVGRFCGRVALSLTSDLRAAAVLQLQRNLFLLACSGDAHLGIIYHVAIELHNGSVVTRVYEKPLALYQYIPRRTQRIRLAAEQVWS
ncbi:hypothetical protein THAOC_08845 [Thalassiosira oceanica]|uniref:Uncharacterized protein n=1 Tax=Thalassiosira oceanica TaxID=159749 RepID=K0T8Y7_THAOC|nr:hypothetical protein THAOC_08845 [Thalassiosira oceanica]|eukprot:EJK69861.1 hypothetical protein THAOC_08845 [Thalassiosira oceanica]